MSGVARRRNDVAFREVEGQTVIVLPRSQDVMVLNATGGFVWNHTDGRRDVAGVAGELARQYDVPVERARADVEELYRELLEGGAISFDE